MEKTPRELLYERLPALAPPGLLYDHDVVVAADGTFLTVSQAWHGPDGVSALACLPGALPLALLGGGFGTNLPVTMLSPADPPVFLLGSFDGGEGLVLAAEAGSGGELAARFPGYARFRAAQLVGVEQVAAGQVLVLDDGLAYELLAGDVLARLDPATGQHATAVAPVPLAGRLAGRDLPELPLTRLV